MEPQALKDYLESLLNEHDERFLGGILKNTDSASLCYQEVMPTGSPSCETEVMQEACPTAQPQGAANFGAAAELYQNYAMNALKNLATMMNQAAPVDNSAAACPTTMNIKAPVHCAMPEKAAEEADTCMPAVSHTAKPVAAPVNNACGTCMSQIPQEIMQVDLLISQQLERIEHMLREMYMTNQELFKSIITYCRTYEIDEDQALEN